MFSAASSEFVEYSDETFSCAITMNRFFFIKVLTNRVM
jgi:hypothetical protein